LAQIKKVDVELKIIIVIGTRPQYIKLKPLYDYILKNNIDHYIIDTNQHYSDSVSKKLIDEMGLRINCNLNVSSVDEVSFLSNGLTSVYRKLKEIGEANSTVIVVGDTNSTLISSIAAKKLGMNLAHIESGIRCCDRNRPEEINRIMVDSISDIHFISRSKDSSNVSNPIYVGDLEYNFLNSIEDQYNNVSYNREILLTVHRQENMSVDNLNKIFNYCHSLGYPIIFPMHHRTKSFINDKNILIPDNIAVVDPMGYMDTISLMRECRGIISDSGGISKTSPFFGKKCIIPLDKVEWSEAIDEGYATNLLNRCWFDDYKIDRNMKLYYVENSCELIVNKILEG
jgi:UDP-GlcNAc3NAcA epimerase